MKILVVNDDGIDCEGIKRLAHAASKIGDVYVVAPSGQCSAMSQKITIRNNLIVKKESFDSSVKAAYSVTGTPADCVKVAFEYLKIEPDVVFSGINMGYNTGFDIAYSGTIGACMEALQKGVRAIAFSNKYGDEYGTVDKYLYDIASDLLKKDIGKNEIWNVNFPGIKASECKGILYDRVVNQSQYVLDNYVAVEKTDDIEVIDERGIFIKEAPIETDIGAVFNGYISIGKITSMVVF